MRYTRREVPQIAFANIIHEVAPILVDSGDARTTVEHERPLGFLVPMQLAHTARSQAHIHAGERGRDRQFTRRHLPRPAAFTEPVVRVGKRELQVGERAVISTGWS